MIDANDAGCNVLGLAAGLERRFVERLFADNPLGQAREQTPDLRRASGCMAGRASRSRRSQSAV